MAEWEAPAKINLSLLVGDVDEAGMHPIRSLAQTVGWLDHLRVEEAEEDRLEVVGPPLPEDGDNLVWRAVEAVTAGARRPALACRLEKRLPVAAGLGGGSSDAAAAMAAVARLLRLPPGTLEERAPGVGADVPFLLRGGTALVEGRGETVLPRPPLHGFAVAVAVPPFQLSTREVYRRWDEMGSPTGEEPDTRHLPPPLREEAPLRNDLTPAAIALRPELADWMRDLAARWGRPVAMSGSGPSLFGFFLDEEEARAAAREAGDEARAAWGGSLRARGVAEVTEE